MNCSRQKDSPGDERLQPKQFLSRPLGTQISAGRQVEHRQMCWEWVTIGSISTISRVGQSGAFLQLKSLLGFLNPIVKFCPVFRMNLLPPSSSWLNLVQTDVSNWEKTVCVDYQGKSEGFSRPNNTKTQTRISSCWHVQRFSPILITITLPCDVLRRDARHQQYTCSP
jgi:hypothetical protein